MTIELGHYDDGKQKWQSHEIKLVEEYFYDANTDVFSYNPFNIIGYGKTKEEALENFKCEFEYVMSGLNAFSNMLFETNVITDNIVELDFLGRKITN